MYDPIGTHPKKVNTFLLSFLFYWNINDSSLFLISFLCFLFYGSQYLLNLKLFRFSQTSMWLQKISKVCFHSIQCKSELMFQQKILSFNESLKTFRRSRNHIRRFDDVERMINWKDFTTTANRISKKKSKMKWRTFNSQNNAQFKNWRILQKSQKKHLI